MLVYHVLSMVHDMCMCVCINYARQEIELTNELISGMKFTEKLTCEILYWIVKL